MVIWDSRSLVLVGSTTDPVAPTQEGPRAEQEPQVVQPMVQTNVVYIMRTDHKPFYLMMIMHAYTII